MNKNKIFFCGDNHGHFRHIVQAVKEHRPDAIILLGDIQAQRPLEVELAPITGMTAIHFIHGNHDTDSDADYINLFGSSLSHLNLHGRVVEVAGVRIAGLGGIFRGKIRRPPENDRSVESYEALKADTISKVGWGQMQKNRADGLLRQHMSSIFPDVYDQLMMAEADVLVTHEAPSCHPFGFEAIDWLAQSLKVSRAFHGHHHDSLDYSRAWASLGFKAYGVGFCGIMDFDGNCIQAGEFDVERASRYARYDLI